MKRKQQKQAVERVIGKGPVRYTQPGGTGSPLAISIDFRYAKPPEAYAYADCVSVKNDPEVGMATILLGHADTQAGKVKDCISIVLPSAALLIQFLSTTTSVEETLRAQLNTMGMSVAKRAVGKEAELRASLFANVLALHTGPGDSSLDFYYLPVRDIHLAKEFQTEIPLEQVIRIVMPLPVLQYFFELCRSLAQSLQPAAQTVRTTNRVTAS